MPRPRALLLSVAALLVSACGPSITPIRTTLPDGALLGRAIDGTQVFLGVPYAEPPTGARRFAPPTPVRAWTAPRDATHPGPLCPQLSLVGGECDARRVARLHAESGNVVFVYNFARAYYEVFLQMGAFHGSELPFVFGNPLAGLPLLPMGQPLKRAVQGYWTDFARLHDPNRPRRVVWPRYDAASDATLVLDERVHVHTALRAEACAFWDALREH